MTMPASEDESDRKRRARWERLDAQREAHQARMEAQHQAERTRIAILIGDALYDSGMAFDEDLVSIGRIAYDAIDKAGYIFASIDTNGWENQ